MIECKAIGAKLCLPVKVIALVREWIEKNKTELLHMWETQEFKMLAPLE